MVKEITKWIFVFIIAVSLSFGFIFTTKSLNSLYTTLEKNSISKEILEKNNFIYEEVQRNYIFKDNEKGEKNENLIDLFNKHQNKKYKEHDMLVYLGLIDETSNYKIKKVEDKEKNMLKACFIYEYESFNHKNFLEHLSFIKFVDNLENNKIEGLDTKSETYQKLLEAKTLMEDNISQFHEKGCTEEFLGILKGYITETEFLK